MPSAEVRAEFSLAQDDSASSISRSGSRRSLESHKRSRPYQPLHVDCSPLKKKPTRRKTVRFGEQHAVWKALDLVSSSPFSSTIKRPILPERFTALRFETYNGRTDPVAHISHYQQRMALCQYNDPLMCRLFPSSLGEVALRWFNQLGKRTISSWNQMAEAFVVHFITNSQRTKEMDALITLKLEEGESLKDYVTRFWETYNDIDNCSEDVVVRTFKSGLPLRSGLRLSLTKHPTTILRKLIDRIEQFIRVEEDGGNTSSKQTVILPKVMSTKPPARSNNSARAPQASSNFVAPSFRAFQMVFKEPIYKIMNKIKGKPYFVWPPKLLGDPASRDPKLQCLYHRDKGHLTENCHMLKTHLEQLASAGHLNQYIDDNLSAKRDLNAPDRRPNNTGAASLGVIHVILNPLCSSILPSSYRSEIQKAVHLRRSYATSDLTHLAPSRPSCEGS
jgi:hypothetical protein